MSRYVRLHNTTTVTPSGVRVNPSLPVLPVLPVLHSVTSTDTAVVTVSTSTPIGSGTPLVIRRVAPMSLSATYSYVP